MPSASCSQNADKKRVLRSQTQPVLLPKGQTGQNTRHIKARTKLPPLQGADLYATRLGWNTHFAANDSNACCASSSDKANYVTPVHPPTGSLHDELINPRAKPSRVSVINAFPEQKLPSVLASRPCYRCISYMATVGIKRVFWTTDTGAWQDAKVRDLVNALDKLGQAEPSETSAALSTIFVTKHEVLMLRRTMGGD
jgi:hypothetical protein